MPKETKPKFFRTVFTAVVLSEEPITNLSLAQLHYETQEGHCVLQSLSEKQTAISGKRAANELYKAGSEPSFFNLDDDGKSIDS